MHRNTDRGYTLTEIVVVLFIATILATIAIPVYLAQIQKARDVQIQTDLRQVAIDVLAYAAQHGYPDDVNPGIEPVPDVHFPAEPGRTIDYDRFCVNHTQWAKVLSYPTTGRTDEYLQPGVVGIWTRSGRDWALTLWVSKC